MSTRGSQAESFDSTAKLMIEALAKASAELEKSVTAFTEQLISFNESVQKSLDEELRAVKTRMESAVKNNLDELQHNKHVMMKRLLDAERVELDALSDVGRQVRATLNNNAQQIESKIEQFIDAQIKELRSFLEQPEAQIEQIAHDSKASLADRKSRAASHLKEKQDEFRKKLADRVADLEREIVEHSEKARAGIASMTEQWGSSLTAEREAYCQELDKNAEQTVTALKSADAEGHASLEQAEEDDKDSLETIGKDWRQQVNSQADAFNKLINNLSSVLKENFETRLSNAADQARQEITVLSDQAHEKISATRSELEVELHDLEKDCLHQLEATLRKLEAMVLEHANDKRNSGVARQHKAQKLRDQMQTHLKRFGASLVDSIKDAATALENDFDRATDGFHVRIEGARTSAIESLERESKLMQKDIDRTLKEFQRELSEQEAQIHKIEHAGQDAVVTVIACRKAMLSFKGE